MSNGYLIDSFGRDSLEDAISRIEALEAKTEIYAVARGSFQTDGAGGFNYAVTEKCSLSIDGNFVRVTFDDNRPDIEYSVSAIREFNSNEYLNSSSHSRSGFRLQVRDDAGSSLSASTSVVSGNFTVHDTD